MSTMIGRVVMVGLGCWIAGCVATDQPATPPAFRLASGVTEKDAIKIARTIVDAYTLGVTVPAEAEVEVKHEDDKFIVTFLEPPVEEPYPRAGYYAIVIVESAGTITLFCPP